MSSARKKMNQAADVAANDEMMNLVDEELSKIMGNEEGVKDLESKKDR